MCVKNFMLEIGKENQLIFKAGRIYPCTIRHHLLSRKDYKIYGKEYALSCDYKKFNEYFTLH